MAFGAPSEGSDIMDRLAGELGTIKKPHIIVTIAHLYLEYFLQRLIEESFENHERMVGKKGRDASYLTKVKLLYARRILDDDEFNDLLLINSFRNEFAHNLDPNEDKIMQKCNDLILLPTVQKAFYTKTELLSEIVLIIILIQEKYMMKITNF